MLRDSGVKVYYHTRLRAARRHPGKSHHLSHHDLGWPAVAGKDFADCTYEGDLMRKSNVSYTWGAKALRNMARI